MNDRQMAKKIISNTWYKNIMQIKVLTNTLYTKVTKTKVNEVRENQNLNVKVQPQRDRRTLNRSPTRSVTDISWHFR